MCVQFTHVHIHFTYTSSNYLAYVFSLLACVTLNKRYHTVLLARNITLVSNALAGKLKTRKSTELTRE